MRDHGEANLTDKQKLAADYFMNSKITLDWPDSHTDAAEVSVSLKMSRLIYNLLILSSGSLIRGGTISVRITKTATHKVLTVTSHGSGLKWDEEIAAMFTGHILPESLNPKNVQAYLTRCFCEELGATFSATVADEQLRLQIEQPVGL